MLIPCQTAAEPAEPKGKTTKNCFVWTSALALAVTVSSQPQSMGLTNGMVLITTRKAQDMSFTNTTDNYDYQGPGAISPGDVAMAEWLGDNGYSCRIMPDAFLNAGITNPLTGNAGNPGFYLFPGISAFGANLVILSGSSASGDIPFIDPTYGIAIMIGEHSCLGDRSLACSCFMYTHGTNSGNLVNPAAGQYMKVIAPNHPIMQGIPLDS